jgi:hypothetical protein
MQDNPEKEISTKTEQENKKKLSDVCLVWVLCVVR